MRNTFTDVIIDQCRTRDDVFVITGDAGLGVFDSFREEHPGRFLNMGVAEQNMAGFAAGLSMTGFKVVLYNIIPFLLYRCYEQVRNDICYQNLPVVLAGIGSGLTYAPQGMTHYSVEDIGIARTLPNLTVISPIDPVEAKLAAGFAMDSPSPVYVRLPKRGEPVLHRTVSFDISEPMTLEDGEDIAILFHGSVGVEVVKAREILAGLGISPRLVSVPMLQPLSWGALLGRLRDVRTVFTVEEHYSGLGLGSIVAREMNTLAPPWRLHTLGIRDGFIHEIRDNAGMRKLHGIDAAGIADSVRSVLCMGGR